jgi:chromosome segregation ATPase
VPKPRNEREALEEERAELVRQIAGYRQELENALSLPKTRRERLEWQIRRDEKRLAEVKARLAALRRVPDS